MKPRCVIDVRPDKVARVCAWCPDKEKGDEWAEARGYDVTHTFCENCARKQLCEIRKLKQETQK